MAVTKVFAIRGGLKKSVAYITNQEKTTLDEAIVYAVNETKTEQHFFESALNCASVEGAYNEMQQTKRAFGKEDGILGYHIIQSFQPGEISPELTHKIGVALADRLAGHRFQVVIGTHLDKHHLHNHIVVNSVSFADGKKFRCNMSTYFNQIQKVSDELCRAHGLSIVKPQSKGKSHQEWQAEKSGTPTIRGQLRGDIDGMIAQCLNYPMFLEALQKSGYLIKHGNVKHTAIKPPFSKRFIRLDSLGKDYTLEAITRRIAEQQSWAKRVPPPKPVRRKMKGSLHRCPKIKGFRALYFRYVYLLRGTTKRGRKKVSRYLLDEKVKFERYRVQHAFLADHHIDTSSDLQRFSGALTAQIQTLVNQRLPRYDERRSTDDPTQKEILSQQIATHTAQIKALRRQLRLCHQIETDSIHIKEKLHGAQQIQQEAKAKTQHKQKQRS